MPKGMIETAVRLKKQAGDEISRDIGGRAPFADAAVFEPAVRPAVAVSASTAKVSASFSGIATPCAQVNKVTATKIGANPDRKLNRPPSAVMTTSEATSTPTKSPRRSAHRANSGVETTRKNCGAARMNAIWRSSSPRAPSQTGRKGICTPERQESRGVEERQPESGVAARSASQSVNPSPRRLRMHTIVACAGFCEALRMRCGRSQR